jgi:hypothetical protein
MNPAARELIADAKRRARLLRSARTEEMRRALAHRICFDLVMALRAGSTNTPAREGERRGMPAETGLPDAEVTAGALTARSRIEQA